MNIRLIIVTGLAVCTALWTMARTAHGQVQGGDLFATNNLGGTCGNGGSSIFQYTPQYIPLGPRSIFASNLAAPRGLAFDSAGNLFVATNSADDSCNIQATIFKITPDGVMSTFATGFGTNIFLSALATDSEGNVFVDGSDFTSDTGPSTIYKITPGGTVSMVASIPGGFWGLGFDSAGNIYAAAGGDAATYSYAAIYKYTSAGAPYEPTPTGVPGVFADYTRFTSPQSPVGLAFDSSGNLFVSTTDVVTYSGNGGILEFYPDGTESTFATGLTKNPRGLAFDSGGNLFVAEVSPSGAGNTGDILEFTYGGTGSVGSIVPASGWGVAYLDQGIGSRGNLGPEYLAFTTGAVTPVNTAVTLTFPEGTSAGTTTVTPIASPSPAPSPSEFQLGNPPLAFDITTTATYTVPIIIAFQVPQSFLDQCGCDVSTLRVLHGTNLDNVTAPNPPWAPNPTTRTVYASVSSLSPFVIAKLRFGAQVQQPINADGSSVFSVRRGVVPVKFTLTQDGASTCALPPATFAVTRTAGGAIGAINESVYSGSADTGSNFRIVSCQYVYNLNSGALGAGTYRTDIKINGTVVGNAVFQLK